MIFFSKISDGILKNDEIIIVTIQNNNLKALLGRTKNEIVIGGNRIFIKFNVKNVTNVM